MFVAVSTEFGKKQTSRKNMILTLRCQNQFSEKQWWIFKNIQEDCENAAKDVLSARFPESYTPSLDEALDGSLVCFLFTTIHTTSVNKLENTTDLYVQQCLLLIHNRSLFIHTGLQACLVFKLDLQPQINTHGVLLATHRYAQSGSRFEVPGICVPGWHWTNEAPSLCSSSLLKQVYFWRHIQWQWHECFSLPFSVWGDSISI